MTKESLINAYKDHLDKSGKRSDKKSFVSIARSGGLENKEINQIWDENFKKPRISGKEHLEPDTISTLSDLRGRSNSVNLMIILVEDSQMKEFDDRAIQLINKIAMVAKEMGYENFDIQKGVAMINKQAKAPSTKAKNDEEVEKGE